MASDENADNNKRKCQCKREVQRGSGKFESYKNKKQDAEAQRQPNADNLTASSLVSYPNVIINNRNGNSFSAETRKIATVSFQS